VELHVHQAAGERVEARAAVALDVLPEQPELGQAAHERPGQLGRLPVLVDRRQDLAVDEAPVSRKCSHCSSVNCSRTKK
jgi:hypothetical protein